ncbi:transcriptional regulator [Asanoa ishikariensis]|uniref:Transcriptional regulator, HxlR family n=1 Tax=Asanoa ishikariensis TaxID=137265 RepID=A0A1H3UNJ4_9ACTN|nr:helix-turn-helix domain-containing protein [Asanoa ishikariensis]GIF69076.1 transcriptional regulator [Asanoa ishikariensis]SDZ64020.1 transcriptional regulator, HxlR family [Asanoa ishikariensis]
MADVRGPAHRSGCPINLSVEILGDRWSLVVLRDVMFGDRHYFRELLTGSQEGIASNILADRLRRLVANGLLWRSDDASHRQKIRYSLTEAGVQLVPVMAALGSWGRRHLPASHELSVRAELLERGGPELWDRFMDELREQHLGIARPPGTPSVFAELQAAYEAAVSRGAPAAPDRS